MVNMEGKYTQKPTMNIKRVFCHSLNDLGSFIVVCDWGFFVISCGFQDRGRRAGNQVDHGHERLRVAIPPSSGTRRLEYAIQAFQSRIGIG